MFIYQDRFLASTGLHADAATADGSQPHPYLGAALAIAGRHARAREVLGRLIDINATAPTLVEE